MIPELRQRFLNDWTVDSYARFQAELEAQAGTALPFRFSETPVFYPRELLATMVRCGQELYSQLAADPTYCRESDRAIPVSYCVPNEAPHPLFVQADFGLVRTPDGRLEPKLVEIQGFPSIYVLQYVAAESYRKAYNLDALSPVPLAHLWDGLDGGECARLLRAAIVGDHDPADVVLLEIDPAHQKTAADFDLTKRLLGIRICPVTEVQKRGSKLFFEGREIRRIYNRVIVDELERKQVGINFDFRDDLDVEWAGHPNWFFRLSKFSLPYLDHPCVPRSRFLHQIATLPDDLDNFVLKPLYSFAGQGVVVGPTRAEVDAIPDQQRPDYLLQERMRFTPTLDTPSGPTVVETRVMYLWDPAAGQLRALQFIVRTGRGKMMGVDFNKNLDWVGASSAFYPVA